MGMVRVCCSRAAVVGVLCERIRSGCSATSSFANRCHRLRVAGCRPASVDPDVAALRPPELLESLPECGDEGLSFRSLSAYPISTPIRRIPPGCCARAASGHAAAAPPSSVMNSRRFNGSNCIDARQPDPIRKLSHWRGCVRWCRIYFTTRQPSLSPVRV